MGTRADFYVGRAEKAEWLGSIAWDAYPDGLTGLGVIEAKTEAAYRKAVAKLIASREDGTLPEAGWPWPWDDSRTTDYAYAFEAGEVLASPFGRAWFKASEPEPELGLDSPKVALFPDMSHRKRVAAPGGARSGVILLGTGKKTR